MMKFRHYLVLLFVIFLVACGDDSAEPTPETAQPSALQVVFASDDFYVGNPRIPIILFDGVAAAEGLQSVVVTLFDISAEPPKAVWQGDAREYPDGPMGYWTVAPPIPSAGDWGLDIAAITASGEPDNYQRVLTVNEQPVSPAIGIVPPASENRTSATHKLSALSSGPDPDPTLYDMTVAEALASGKPSVITFATPAFCQTQFCAPVVDVVSAASTTVGESVNFIHLEIYQDFQNLTPAPEVDEWGLTSEPWTFILDAEGKVAARLGGPISEQEILEVLERLQ